MTFKSLRYTWQMPKGEYLQYGGLAIIEGVMMRSPHYYAVACRAPDHSIVVKTEPISKTWIGKLKFAQVPFLRGALALLDGMALGHRAMRFASNVQLDPTYGGTPFKTKADPTKGTLPKKKDEDGVVMWALVIGLALGLVIFQGIPNQIAAFMKDRFGLPNDYRVSLITEAVKIVFFIAYIAGISLIPEIKRLFQYHGAEHKAINVIEADEELTMDNCKAQTRLHPRCGTSFAIIVLIVSFIVFPFIPRPEGFPWFLTGILRLLTEIPLMFLVAGISYELLRFAGKMRNSNVVMFFFKPGLWTQLLTTKEPDFTQIEVSLAALTAVMKAEETGTYEPDPVVLGKPNLAEPEGFGEVSPAQV